MRCTNCGTELSEDSVFCTYCGAQQSVSAGYWAEDNNAYVDPAIADPYAAEAVPQSAKPKRTKLKIILASIAAVLVVVIIAGLCTNWFGFYGPATRIGLAAKNTVQKGNFTLEVISEIGGHESEMTIQVNMDVKKRELTMFGKMDGNSFAIYDGYVITGTSFIGEKHYYKHDISDQLDEIFDAYEEADEVDLDELFDAIEDYTGIDLRDYLDVYELEKCSRAYLRKLNNNKWLKENAGYTKIKKNGITYFNFDPKPYTFASASLECFEKAFEDEDDYEDAQDLLKNYRRYLNELDVEMSFGLKGNKLVEVSIGMGDDGSMTMEFTDIGKTEIDVDLLEDLLDQADEI